MSDKTKKDILQECSIPISDGRFSVGLNGMLKAMEIYAEQEKKKIAKEAYFDGFNQAHYSHLHPETFPVKECETAAQEYMALKFPLYAKD